MPIASPSRSASARSTPRLLELDGIRGLALLAVVANHLDENYQPLVHAPLLHALLSLCNLGSLGVDMFFALSGFLITGNLLEQRGSRGFFRNFYARRLLRLTPAYLITLVLVGSLVPGSGSYLLLSLAYLANFAPIFHVSVAYGILWSLSVEEHFYFLWPTLIRILRPRSIAALCVLLVVLTPLARLLNPHYGSYGYMYSWYRFDGLAWGALLALLMWARNHPSASARRLAWPRRFSLAVLATGSLLFAVGLSIFARHAHQTAQSVLYAAASMMTTGVIGLAALRPGAPGLAILRRQPLRFVGDVSYWAYLTHYLALGAGLLVLHRHAKPLVAGGGWTLVAAGTLLTLAPTMVTGWAVRRWIELPVLRLKSYFR